MRHPATAATFDWDEHNEEHLAEHGVRADEVEQIFLNAPTYHKNKRSAAGSWLMIGQTDAGRSLCISIVWVDERAGILRAITGWPIK